MTTTSGDGGASNAGPSSHQTTAINPTIIIKKIREVLLPIQQATGIDQFHAFYARRDMYETVIDMAKSLPVVGVTPAGVYVYIPRAV